MGSESALALLRVTLPDGTEQVVPIVQSPFNMGRAPTSDLPLPHQLVSRNHARLLFQGAEIVLIDLNSANGTSVGGKRLGASEPYAISYGEAFEVGPYTLRLEAAPATGKEPAGLSADVAAAEEPSRRSRRAQPGGPVGQAPPPQPPEPAEPSLPYDQAFGLPADASRYLQYLPPIYHAHPFLGRFLLAFEGVLGPLEQIVDNFDLYLDPRTAPPFFLDQLAGWLGLTLDEKWPLAKRRAVLAEAAELYRRRGTRWSLARHLEIYTGVRPEISEPEDRPFHFQVSLRVPAGQQVDRATVERIVEANKPAHATYTLEIAQER